MFIYFFSLVGLLDSYYIVNKVGFCCCCCCCYPVQQSLQKYGIDVASLNLYLLPDKKCKPCSVIRLIGHFVYLSMYVYNKLLMAEWLELLF